MNAVLISAERHRRRDALSEAWYVFSEHLGLVPRRYQCRIPGLAIIRVDQDVLEVMSKIRHFVLNTQPSFLACLTFTPLHKLFKLPPTPKDTLKDFEEDVDQFSPIIAALESLMHLIEPKESWRITVRKRYSSLRSQEIITKIADTFSLPGPVSLTDPEKIIRVEVLGSDCGVSIHKPQDVISLPKLGSAGS
ncbi:MAG: THUMP domain-containing protein [Candidatus Hodarchaeales archaeon]